MWPVTGGLGMGGGQFTVCSVMFLGYFGTLVPKRVIKGQHTNFKSEMIKILKTLKYKKEGGKKEGQNETTFLGGQGTPSICTSVRSSVPFFHFPFNFFICITPSKELNILFWVGDLIKGGFLYILCIIYLRFKALFMEVLSIGCV